MYEKGQGVLGDYREAVKWYRKAAEQGDASAQNNLGVMYADGAGVLQDYVTAYAWANVAEANGNDVKKFKSEFLEMKMTPDQIAKAEELFIEMVKKNPKLLNKKQNWNPIDPALKWIYRRPEGLICLCTEEGERGIPGIRMTIIRVKPVKYVQ